MKPTVLKCGSDWWSVSRHLDERSAFRIRAFTSQSAITGPWPSLKLPVRLAGTGFAEHALAGTRERRKRLGSEEAISRTSSLRKLRRSQHLGYRFGYRHQFGLFTLNYAKPLMRGNLGRFDITLNYAYLS